MTDAPLPPVDPDAEARALCDQLSRLTHLFDSDLLVFIPQLAAHVERLLAERDAERAKVETLRGYADHSPRCDALKMWPDDPYDEAWRPTCTCGFAAALEEMK